MSQATAAADSVRVCPAVVRWPGGLLPLALTPLWALAIGEGMVDLGGGDKDVFWLLPWTLWSLVFLVAFAPRWRWRGGCARRLAVAAGIATAAVFAVWLGLLGVVGLSG